MLVLLSNRTIRNEPFDIENQAHQLQVPVEDVAMRSMDKNKYINTNFKIPHANNNHVFDREIVYEENGKERKYT